MRKIPAAVLSALLTALIMCAPVSAKSSTVSFEDPEADIGPDPFYNLPTDLTDQPTTSSPICAATYLDLVGGWVTARDPGGFELGMELAGPLDEEIVMPPGATGLLWVWYFYENTEYYADAMAVVSWDGAGFEAYFKYRTEMGAVPYPYWELAFEPDDAIVRLSIGPDDGEPFAIMQGMTAWFVETKVWFSPLVEPWEDWALPPDLGGWYPVDINDWDPTASTLPWLPMPE